MTVFAHCFRKKNVEGSEALGLVSGQAMFLSILAIGGTILGATTIAGLLMIYQLRRTSDLANSAKAIFAADAGLESALYNFYKCNFDPASPGAPCPVDGPPAFSNGAVTLVECLDHNGNAVPAGCYQSDSYDPSLPPSEEIRAIKSVGRAVTSYRAFYQPL